MKEFSLILFVVFCINAYGQKSPHGDAFKVDCVLCHNSSNWKIDFKQVKFDHNTTRFQLEGQHARVNCRMCHVSLVFTDAEMECVNCHTDIHQQTVGNDCERCHNTETWIIENPLDIHRQSRFPLLGMHSLSDCNACHKAAPELQFEPLPIDCYSCHRENYYSSTQPNHLDAGYSTNCVECHSENAYEWDASGFNHDFFPLTLGHAITNCALCHGENKYQTVSNACVDCHLIDYNHAANPVHDQGIFSLQCTECHTTNPGWQPASYLIHDSNSFPIYSGKHRGEWKSCTECHSNSENYSDFNCLSCHEHNKTSMDKEHEGKRGYVYESHACYECHPRGRADDD